MHLAHRTDAIPEAKRALARAAHTLATFAAEAQGPRPETPSAGGALLSYDGRPVPPLIYVCGDYMTGTRKNPIRLLANIRRGKDIADLISLAGAAAYAPWWDADVAAKDPEAPPAAFLVKSLAFLNAAHGLVTCSDWTRSAFQTTEVTIAERRGLPIHHIDYKNPDWQDALIDWVELTCDDYWAEQGLDLDSGPPDLLAGVTVTEEL